MLVFAVPVFGRHTLATVCLRHLARVCGDTKSRFNVPATAVLAGDDSRFRRLADELDFEWVYAPNDPLGKKWNDAYQHACLNLHADFVVPLGSDDVVHPDFFARLPQPGTIGCTRNSAIVSPDGRRIVALNVTYPGGDGVRVFPRDLLELVMWRPCWDDRHRAIDGSITEHLHRIGHPPVFDYRDTNPYAIVDFKTNTPDQRNTFVSCLTFASSERTDVFDVVAEWHGRELADDIAHVYGLVAA